MRFIESARSARAGRTINPWIEEASNLPLPKLLHDLRLRGKAVLDESPKIAEPRIFLRHSLSISAAVSASRPL